MAWSGAYFLWGGAYWVGIMSALILSVGGSLVAPKEFDLKFVQQLKEVLTPLLKSHLIVLSVGGGFVCRQYQQAVKLAQVSPNDLDWVGIMATRLNAESVRAVFGDLAHADVLHDPHVLPKSTKNLFIAAGWKPGCSTDTDAVIWASTTKAKQVVNLTNISQVYTADPKLDPGATPIDRISWGDFQKIVGDKWSPGLNKPFDPVATKKAALLGLEVVILGPSLQNFRDFLEKKSFTGTIIN